MNRPCRYVPSTRPSGEPDPGSSRTTSTATPAATAADIRRCRQELQTFADGTPFKNVTRYNDFFTLVFIPQGRIIATLRSASQCRTLAAELARVWVRWGGEEPAEDPAPLLQRFQREDV